ncbi:universal stress protein [Robertkochia sediminum]|uniref:universal stress protein n=1 Tax=Robertkochia sediminum TaxID=2785326 RepID=UPI0019342968|nr:universal stress protein [Robertkochia sediminum]MBL7473016.1 universal stress protein [Robertkochia sediminum]
MKKILVPTDFSDNSLHALKVAAKLANKYNAKLYLLHMLGISQTIIGREETNEGAEAIYYMKLVKRRFDELRSMDFMQGIEVEEMVQNYKIFSEVNNVAHEKGIDLVVMGSHGTGMVNDFFVGSNTEKVVRTSDFPVLVIKKDRPDFKMDKVVFACDFDKENIHAYRKAMHLFKKFESEVHLLYVNLPNQNFLNTPEMEERIKDFIAEADEGDLSNMDKVTYYSGYTIENGIYNFSQKIGADLIAIPTHGRRGLSHFFMGSIGEDLANRSELPVLTFKI